MPPCTSTLSSVAVALIQPKVGARLSVAGLAKFDVASGSIAMSTPQGWPGVIAFSNGGNRRDIIYQDDAMYIVASSTSSAPSLSEGITTLNGGNVGIQKTPSSSYELDVGGDIRCVSLTETSDIRFKKDIATIDNALKDIMRIDGVKYNWDQDAAGSSGLSDRRQIGLVAQDVEEILPELVSTDDEGFKSVSYSKMTAVLLEAIKELKRDNDELRLRLDRVEDKR